MKQSTTSQKRKQVKRKPQMVLKGAPHYYNFTPNFPLANQMNSIVSGPFTAIKNSIDSDVDFLLTSSSKENTKQDICNRKEAYFEKLDQVFDQKELPTNKAGNISEIFRTKEEALKEFIYGLPHYFYELKSEYSNYRSKYEKAVADLTDKEKTCEALIKRTEELANESNRKSEQIIRLMDENEHLTATQISIESLRREKEGLIEILKRDSDGKNKELTELIRIKSDLKCENSRLCVEKEILERELKENSRNFMKLESEKDVLCSEIGNLNRLVRDTIERFLNSGLQEEIRKIAEENARLVHFQHCFELSRAEIEDIKQKTLNLKDKVLRITDLQECHRKKEESKLEWMRKGAKSVSMCIDRMRKGVKEVERRCEEVRSSVSVEKIQAEFMKIFNQQKNEFEVQKQVYEKKIRELTEQIEEQVDVWKVFER